MKNVFSISVIALFLFTKGLNSQCYAPSLYLPSNGSTIYTLTPYLNWYPGQYMIGYNLYISTSPTINPVIHSANISSSQTSYLVPSGVLQYNQRYYWQVWSNCFHTSSGSTIYNFISSITGLEQISSVVPEVYNLFQNYPNPFNPTTKIKFDIPPSSLERAGVRLIVYDVLGRVVQTLVNEHLPPGTYEVDFDGSNFSCGVYYYTLKADASASLSTGYFETKRMVLLK